MLCYAMLCYAILYYTILYFTVEWSKGIIVFSWRKVSKVASLSAFGGRFAGGGFVGRASLSLACLQEFVVQLCAAPRVSALRLPASVN